MHETAAWTADWFDPQPIRAASLLPDWFGRGAFSPSITEGASGVIYKRSHAEPQTDILSAQSAHSQLTGRGDIYNKLRSNDIYEI